MKIIIMVISLLLFGLMIWALTVSCDISKSNKSINEPWVNYMELPYGNIYTGAGNKNIRPVSFYNNPIYRRPLNWPVCHLVDYPVPHCRSDSL